MGVPSDLSIISPRGTVENQEFLTRAQAVAVWLAISTSQYHTECPCTLLFNTVLINSALSLPLLVHVRGAIQITVQPLSFSSKSFFCVCSNLSLKSVINRALDRVMCTIKCHNQIPPQERTPQQQNSSLDYQSTL